MNADEYGRNKQLQMQMITDQCCTMQRWKSKNGHGYALMYS